MDRILNKIYPKRLIVVFATVAAFAASFICLSNGIYDIYQNIFYIPIILACFWFGKKGFIFSAILSLLHTAICLIYNTEAVWEEIVRLVVFVIIALLIQILTDRIKNQEVTVNYLNKALQNELERFKKAEELTGLGIWEMDLNTGKTVWSNGLFRLFGYDSGSFEPTLAKRIEFTHPLDRNILKEGIEKTIKERCENKFESRIIKTDGTIRWVLSLGYVEYNENNEPQSFIGALLDITERKLAEETEKYYLKRNESLIRIFMRESDSIKDLLNYVLNEAINLTESKIGAVYLYNEKNQELILNNISKGVLEQSDVDNKTSVHNINNVSLLSKAVRLKQPVLFNDFREENFPEIDFHDVRVNLLNLQIVPVFDGEEIAAVVCLANKESDYTILDSEQIRLLMVNAWEFIKRKKAEASLDEEREKFKTTIASIGDGVIATDSNGQITVLNKVAEKLTGWKQEEACGKPFSQVFNIINEYTREKCENPIQKVIQSGLIIGLANHTALISKYGTERSIADSAAPIRSNDGNIQGVVLVFRDVTEEKRRQDEINYISYHDSLTGLYNRRFLEEELKRADTESNLPISIIMGDVNGLKLTNDAFGHIEGDHLLQKASEAIQGACRMNDIAARWGGDEFVILLPKTNAEQSEKIVKRIKNICAEMKVDSINVSVSFGCCTKENIEDELLKVLKNAEDHMYEEKIIESESMRGNLVTTIINTLHEKSPKEEQHSKRVSEICQDIGKAMGLSEKDINMLKLIGLLHDIGKIALDENILNKPGKLNSREWDEIKRHPDIGYRILCSSHEMAELADYVLAHHEKYDGSGYPKGLVAEEIPLLSRIVAVADAYDSMTSDRKYRAALDEKTVIEEINKNKGLQFDPFIADAFLEKVLPHY